MGDPMAEGALLREAADNPAWFILGCLVWFPVAAWVLSLVHWSISGEVDAWIGVIGSIVAIMLGMATTRPPEPWMSPLFFTAVLGTIAAYPIARNGIQRRAHLAMDLQSMQEAHLALQLRPDNVSAAAKYCELLVQKGYPLFGIAILEHTLTGKPANLFQQELRQLEAYKAMRYPGSFSLSIHCPQCSAPNSPGWITCASCGSAYLVETASGVLLGSKLARKAVLAWCAGVITVVGLPYLSAAPWHWGIRLPLMALVLGLAVFLILSAFVHSMKETQT